MNTGQATFIKAKRVPLVQRSRWHFKELNQLKITNRIEIGINMHLVALYYNGLLLSLCFVHYLNTFATLHSF